MKFPLHPVSPKYQIQHLRLILLELHIVCYLKFLFQNGPSSQRIDQDNL